MNTKSLAEINSEAVGANEINRLVDLRLYNILDTSAEKAFDDLTRIASAIFETPICLVSLIDEDRQWFKSRQGLDATETPRAHAFCAHAIKSDDIMIVEDASLDERFRSNPLVLESPNIRFYAGAPLKVESGSVLGTLCVIDSKPRTLTIKQHEILGVLRDAVVSQLELRRAKEDLVQIQKIIPMCAWCRKVRVEDERESETHWQSLHEFVMDVSGVTHGICPDCKTTEVESYKDRKTADGAL